MENDTDCFFELDKTASTKFFVQTKPIIKFLIPENANSSKLSFPLNFIVDHPVSEIAYCLDEQESVPINGNTTLTDLPNGQHNVTVYATDEFGYTGKSETLFFNVNAPESTEFSVVPLVIAFVIIVVIVGAGWLVYFRRRKVQP
jgi:hypothetical protein